MKFFKTFFIGGYECADLINNSGNRVDLLAATAHHVHTKEDYEQLASIGIKTVREGIRWSFVEKQPHQYDFSEVENRIMAAQQTGMQQLWDICHFGYPDNLMPTHPQFADRFAALCKAFALLYRQYTSAPLIVTPINEISFLSWLGGDVRGTVPFAINSGFDLKYHLCKATIKGIQAIRSVDPHARIVLSEPLIKVHPIKGKPVCETTKAVNNYQFQAMDIITGRMCPELGGRREYMDMAGFNFYYNNQRDLAGNILPWCPQKRKTCFSELLINAYRRYNCPVVLTETGHFGEDRAQWLQQITTDCIKAMEKGVDLRGICIYPVLDRPDWDEPARLIPCGLWSYNQTGERMANKDYLTALLQCQQTMAEYLAGKEAQKEKIKSGNTAKQPLVFF